MIDTSQTPSTPSTAILIIKRGLLSLGSAGVSLIIMLAFVYFNYFNLPVGGGWFPVWWAIAAYASAVYIKIYLILFLPLFLLVRPQNYLWSIYFTPISLAVTGWIISKFVFSSQIIDPLLEDIWLPVTSREKN
jgi:hypothetical protein